jgi:hypothetical protein
MTPAQEPPRDWEDRVIRETLLHPAHLRSFLGQVVPHLAPGFECEQARLLDREFPWENWQRREADLPFEIPYRTAEGEKLALVFVLIEHQSDTDPLIPLRMLSFLVGYWDRQWQQWKSPPQPRPPFRLHMVLPVVLYTGRTPWGSNRALADLFGEPTSFHAFAPVFQPLFWNLADQTPQALVQTGEEWLQMLAVFRGEEEGRAEFEALFREAVHNLAALGDRDVVRWDQLLRTVTTFATSRRPTVERDTLLEVVRQENPHRVAEIQAMTKTIAEAWMDEGRAEGLAEGLAKGRAEGRAEGELQASRRLLQVLLEDAFGPLPEAVVQQIEATTDLQRLQAAVRQARRLQRLEDLKL